MTSLIPTSSDWLASGGKWIVPAAYSAKLREREGDRTWEGKTDIGSVEDRKREREREKGTKQDRLMLRQASTMLLSLRHTHTHSLHRTYTHITLPSCLTGRKNTECD